MVIAEKHFEGYSPQGKNILLKGEIFRSAIGLGRGIWKSFAGSIFECTVVVLFAQFWTIGLAEINELY